MWFCHAVCVHLLAVCHRHDLEDLGFSSGLEWAVQFGKSRGCELAATNVKKLWVPAHLELISRVTMILIYVIEQVSSRLLMESFFSFFRPRWIYKGIPSLEIPYFYPNCTFFSGATLLAFLYFLRFFSFLCALDCYIL